MTVDDSTSGSITATATTTATTTATATASSAEGRRKSDSRSCPIQDTRSKEFSEIITTLTQAQEILICSMKAQSQSQGQEHGQNKGQGRRVVPPCATESSKLKTQTSDPVTLTSPSSPPCSPGPFCPLLLNIQGNIGIARMLQYQDRVQFLSSLSYNDRRLFLVQSASTAEAGRGRAGSAKEVGVVVVGAMAESGYGTLIPSAVDEAEGRGNPLCIPGMDAIANARVGLQAIGVQVTHPWYDKYYYYCWCCSCCCDSCMHLIRYTFF